MKTIKSSVFKMLLAFFAVILILSVQMASAQRDNQMNDEDLKLKKEYSNDDEFKKDANAKFNSLQKLSNRLEQKISSLSDTKLKAQMTELNNMINNFLADFKKYDSGNYNDANHQNEKGHLQNQFEQIREKYISLRDQMKSNKSGDGTEPKNRTKKKSTDSKEDKM